MRLLGAKNHGKPLVFPWKKRGCQKAKNHDLLGQHLQKAHSVLFKNNLLNGAFS